MSEVTLEEQILNLKRWRTRLDASPLLDATIASLSELKAARERETVYKTRDRAPTKSDADEDGYVLTVVYKQNRWDYRSWHKVADKPDLYRCWTRTLPMPLIPDYTNEPLHPAPQAECATCGGTRAVKRLTSHDGAVWAYVDCPDCNGTGHTGASK